MNEFFAKHQQHISGVLCGFDRLVFHGNLRPIQYVASSSTSKEELARRMAQEQQITQGLVGVLTSVAHQGPEESRRLPHRLKRLGQIDISSFS